MKISSSWIEAAGTQKKYRDKQTAEKLHKLVSKKAEILEKVQV
jgi:hypothetical protein